MKWEKKRRGEGKKKLYFSTTTTTEFGGGRDRGWNTRGGRDRFCSSRD